MTNTSLLELHRIEDGDQFRAVMTDVFTPHSLDVERGSVLDASVRVHSMGRIQVVLIKYGAPVRIGVVPSTKPFHMVQMPLHGHVCIASGNEEIVSTPSVASVADSRLPCEMRWAADCSEIIVRIDDDVLQHHLESLLGHRIKAPIHFSLGMPLGSGPGQTWRAAIDMMVAELHRDESLLHSTLMTTELETLILTGLLTAQPHNYTSALHSEAPAVPPRAVSRAVDYIETAPSRAITTAHLAAQAGVSARALQRGFQTYVGCSPMEYLRDVRLQRARDALASADMSSNVTVTEVAMETGFMHLGRFSVEYRRKFGESPSETLRR
jgi:AraC-like DNA-binding protein